VTAREFAQFWEQRGYPKTIINPITGKPECAAFVTLYSGPEERDDDPDEDDTPLAAE
jgi:hypothetical protein